MFSIDHSDMGHKDHLTIDQQRIIQNGYSGPFLVMISKKHGCLILSITVKISIDYELYVIFLIDSKTISQHTKRYQ